MKITRVGEQRYLSKFRKLISLTASFLGFLTALCLVFILVVTAVEAWEDHARAQWPEAKAKVQRCGLDLYEPDPKYYRIDCRISYTVGEEEITSQVYSRTTPDPGHIIWEYPPQQFKRLQTWVEAHPKGTTIAVHYDPASRKKAVLVMTDMPLAGPTTPGNVSLLGVVAGTCVALLAIARITRPRSIGTSEGG